MKIDKGPTPESLCQELEGECKMQSVMAHLPSSPRTLVEGVSVISICPEQLLQKPGAKYFT